MKFLITFGTFIFTTSLLMLIGEVFSISILRFNYEYMNDDTGFEISVGSIMPFVIGIAMGAIVEKMYEHSVKKHA
ncbi:hypothetical protein [Priestia flexa]|uniref:hypothetical protein n=1 Tax=Priestia flexa TaxID=86664 RepID=UPI001B330A08|nr:hypothetical protein [Priestia flexa]